MLPELYVMRHGETEWNRQRRWQGRQDSPLTATGEAQARALGRLLAARGVGPDSHAILSSPQGRARRTAELAFDGCAPVLDARLREIDVGAFTGLARAEILARTGLDETAPLLAPYAAAPGGETFADLMRRVTGFLADLRRPAVLVTHGITSRFLRTAAMGWGPERIMELPGGQGVVHHLRDGRHDTLGGGGPAGGGPADKAC